MKPTATVHVGDALTVLRGLPDASVQTCITSPPYWNLRDYGVDGQIGLEASIDDWVRALVAVFDDVRRVLRRDGTLWLNVGDAYVTQPPGNRETAVRTSTLTNPTRQHRVQTTSRGDFGGLQRKQRLGLPHRLVFALQAAGWWWRDEIVWHKRCPMPESTRDRATQAHEFLFLLAKRPRYFFDQEGWREPVSGNAHRRGKVPAGWDTATASHRHRRGRYDPKGTRTAAFTEFVTHRNRRSVWTLSPEPFSGAHFATFPTALVEPCILAGSSAAGACAECSAPRERIVRKGEPLREQQRACGGDEKGEYHGQATKDFSSARAENASQVKARILAGMRERVTVGWRPTCRCRGTADVPCVVLDPFAGSGTTGAVALAHGRSFVGVELNPAYAELARRRLDVAPLFLPRAAVGGGR